MKKLSRATTTQFAGSAAEPSSPPLRRQSKLVAVTHNATKFRRSSTMGMVPLDVAAKRRTIPEAILEDLRAAPSNNVALLRAAFKAARIAYSRQIDEETQKDPRQRLRQAFLAVFRGVHATMFLAELMRVWTESAKLHKAMAPADAKTARSSVGSAVRLSFVKEAPEVCGYQARRNKNLLAKGRRESIIEPPTLEPKRNSADGSGQPSEQQTQEPQFGVNTLLRRMSTVHSVRRMSMQWNSLANRKASTETDENGGLSDKLPDEGEKSLEEMLEALRLKRASIASESRSSSSSSSSSSSFGSRCSKTLAGKEGNGEGREDVDASQNSIIGGARRLSFNRVYPDLRDRSPSLGHSSSSSSSSSSRSSSREDGLLFTNEYVADLNAKALERLRITRESKKSEVIPPKKYLISDYSTFRIWAVEALPGFDFVIEDTNGGQSRQLCTDSLRGTFSKESVAMSSSGIDELNTSMASRFSRVSMPQTARRSNDSSPSKLLDAASRPMPSPRAGNSRSAWVDKQASQKPRLLHCIQEGMDFEIAGSRWRRELRVERRSIARANASSPRKTLHGVHEEQSRPSGNLAREAQDRLPRIQRSLTSDVQELRSGKSRRDDEKSLRRSTTFLAARFQAEVASVVLQSTPRRAFDLQDPLL